jgi:beta-aspartyl-dipeptidase (metallo-type)
MNLLIKNAHVFAPQDLGVKDILVGGGKILAIEDHIELGLFPVHDAGGMPVTPGFIDQHVHLIGAGGKHGFASMTPEIMLSEFVKCGSTTVVGMLGTDASARSLKTLYAKTKSLTLEGISAYMFTSYFGIEPVTITGSIMDDLIFVDTVLGCKLAISDERSSYPTATELVRHLRQVHVGGMVSGKGGILHVHLGGLSSKMDILFEMVQQYEFPIKHISPTHVGRSKALFDQAIEFAKLGGIIDITTGASKYTDPWKSVLYAMEQGISLDNLSFSSDGHAGINAKADNGCGCFGKAPINMNLKQVQALHLEGGLSITDAIKPVTTTPARNLSLKNKGVIAVGADADFCCFTKGFELKDVIAKGQVMMKDNQVLVKGAFES